LLDRDQQESPTMPIREMTTADIDRFLSEQRVVRVCFHAFGQLYLIPLDYVWVDGTLCGLGPRGRKITMGEASPAVAFQIDSYTPATGPWMWQSVSGQGAFELVVDPKETERVGAMIQARFSDVPEWFQRERAALAETTEFVFWRIIPSEMAGRALGPGE
jgi:hypothetical protein